MNFMSELKIDFETFKKHTDTPIFHRLKFDETSVYLTKSTFHYLLTSKNNHGYYRVFSWDDRRAKDFLCLELGSVSPALGRVNLIGHFTPTQNDLTEVQYASVLGKAYYSSASGELEGIRPSNGELRKEKIDSRAFMRMGEIIPIGMQGKAIYGEGNYIIDGAAGTGKSTTILQKVKLLTSQNLVPAQRILILVKSKGVIKEFEWLLESMGVKGIKIEAVEEFVSDCFQHPGLDIDSIVNDIWVVASRAKSFILKLKKEEVSLSPSRFLYNVDGNYPPIINEFECDIDLTIIVDRFNRQRLDLIGLRERTRIELSEQREKEDIELDVYKTELSRQIIQKKQEKYDKAKKNENIIQALINKITKPAGPDLTLKLSDDTVIKDAVDSKRKKSKDFLDKLLNKLKDKEQKALSYLLVTGEAIKRRILSKEFSDLNVSGSDESYLLNLLIKKFSGEYAPLHTVIIDEAQDVSLSNIYLAWMMANNVILTGDELQNEVSGGIGCWGGLGRIEKEFLKDGDTNIFTLRHNFRQTFELGNFSFNFRQLVLGKHAVDIGEEYFDNQKGFARPQIAIINQETDFISILNDKIDIVKNSFSDPLPVVIFYQNDASLRRLGNILSNEKIQFGLDGDESKSVMFVGANNISGRSFPVVMMPLLESTTDNSIYIMISRAKFDLCILTAKGNGLNANLNTLLSKGVIVSYKSHSG